VTALEHRSPPPFRAARLDGAAAPIAIPGRARRWLLLTREVACRAQGDVHAHRFIEVDACDGIVGMSWPFQLGSGGERAAGLCDLGAGQLAIAHRCERRHVHWVELEWRAALESLRPVHG
jgi:hypothetical protein